MPGQRGWSSLIGVASREIVMRYRYRLWCDDCADDPHGCFNGGSMLSEETFDTPEQAVEAGSEAAEVCAPWDFCVTDEAGNVIKEHDGQYEQHSIS